MSVVINSNVASLVAQRNLRINTNNLTKSFERLSTGYRINNAGDDAAGLSISEKLRSQIKGYKQSINNAQDGINALQIAESAFDVITDHVQRIRELCVQGANGVYSSTERAYLLDEIKERLNDVNRIVAATKFNDTALLDGTTPELRIQIGARTEVSTNTIDIAAALPADLTVSGMGIYLSAGVTGTTWDPTAIRTYMDDLDVAIDGILSARSKLGSLQNRMDAVVTNLEAMHENLQASESRIRDLDIAEETAEMTRLQILQQSSAQILSQSNQMPSIALQLLGG